MCPDVETYAPLVRGGVRPAAAPAHPGPPAAGAPRRPVAAPDQPAARHARPACSTLADGRVTASQVLDLAASAPVRRAFGFCDDDLERLRDWAGARRRALGAGRAAARRRSRWHGVPQNTWDTGLDRLLLGVAADESDLSWLGLALPLDDVDSSDIDLAGRLAELVDRLDGVLAPAAGPAAGAATGSTR